MSENLDPTDYLRDIVENAIKIETFTAGINFDEFLANDMRVWKAERLDDLNPL